MGIQKFLSGFSGLAQGLSFLPKPKWNFNFVPILGAIGIAGACFSYTHYIYRSYYSVTGAVDEIWENGSLQNCSPSAIQTLNNFARNPNDAEILQFYRLLSDFLPVSVQAQALRWIEQAVRAPAMAEMKKDKKFTLADSAYELLLSDDEGIRSLAASSLLAIFQFDEQSAYSEMLEFMEMIGVKAVREFQTFRCEAKQRRVINLVVDVTNQAPEQALCVLDEWLPFDRAMIVIHGCLKSRFMDKDYDMCIELCRSAMKLPGIVPVMEMPDSSERDFLLGALQIWSVWSEMRQGKIEPAIKFDQQTHWGEYAPDVVDDFRKELAAMIDEK